MVGKSIEPKSSRIFHQCYVKCCKLQNLTPLNNVLPSANGKILDFCVDRIKYADWAPILNALSCDLSLHSVSIRCRQQVKTVLEHIDCERLAKTVSKRAVILTNFMLSNLVEALVQLLANTTLLTSLLLEGLPLRIPYLNPFCEALLSNHSLQHLYLPRCVVGDAGCLALCRAVRCRPSVLTLDLSHCDLTPLGASYIADLVKYQKIHRYSENWVHTLRYRLPELDAMAGLRRISLCGNPGLGDAGVGRLVEVLQDDLWIKALDVQNCGLTVTTAQAALEALSSNTTLVVLDLRHNPDISTESLGKLRAALRRNEQGLPSQYSWLGNVSGCSSEGRLVKTAKNGVKDRGVSNTRNMPSKYTNKNASVKKEKEYAEVLEEQLQEEISHRQQLEELNIQLVEQMKQLKQAQMRLWANPPAYSGSEQSLHGSSRSGALSSSSGSSSSVPIDQSTLSYIQHAFKDIYCFIKHNQCQGLHDVPSEEPQHPPIAELTEPELSDGGGRRGAAACPGAAAKRAVSSHEPLSGRARTGKATRSAHGLHDTPRDAIEMKLEMFERQIGDTHNAHPEGHLTEEMIAAQKKSSRSNMYERSPPSSAVSDSSDTLVCSPETTARPNPREALCSSDDSD